MDLESLDDTQVFFFLKHLCSEDASQCHMNDYMLFCFEYQSMVWDKKHETYEQFYPQWSELVASRFSLPEEDIRAIFNPVTDEYGT